MKFNKSQGIVCKVFYSRRIRSCSERFFVKIMAKKSKRMALYEAIQQGQAKIEEGLKTGHLRSDSPAVRAGRPEIQKTPVFARRPDRKEPGKRQDFLGQFTVSRKTLLIGAVITLQIAVFAVAFWLGALMFKKDEPQSIPGGQISSARAADEVEATESSSGGSRFWAGSSNQENDDTETTSPRAESETPRLGGGSTGGNVIVIQSISWPRKEELRSIQTFFAEKGIQTEIIRDNKSDYALLVTTKGFKEKPENKGSDGYRLLQQIKQYGIRYPEETDDTKWGLKPFQDAYGLKRN